MTTKTKGDGAARAAQDSGLTLASLFHVTSVGKVPGSDVIRVLPRELLRGARPEARTGEAEVGLGLPRSVYLYVGYPAPPFGCVAIAFEPALVFQELGSATPFDTGGLFHGHVALPPGEHPREYLGGHIVRDLDRFWGAFSEYIRCHFDGVDSYCRGDKPQPCSPERGGRHGVCSAAECRQKGRFDLNQERRAWTWEVQVHADIPIHLALRSIYMDQVTAEFLSQTYEHSRTDKEWWLVTYNTKVREVPFPVHQRAEEAEAKSYGVEAKSYA